jgi:hypothetical protein
MRMQEVPLSREAPWLEATGLHAASVLKRVDDLDQPNNVRVKLVQLLGGDP